MRATFHHRWLCLATFVALTLSVRAFAAQADSSTTAAPPQRPQSSKSPPPKLEVWYGSERVFIDRRTSSDSGRVFLGNMEDDRQPTKPVTQQTPKPVQRQSEGQFRMPETPSGTPPRYDIPANKTAGTSSDGAEPLRTPRLLSPQTPGTPLGPKEDSPWVKVTNTEKYEMPKVQLAKFKNVSKISSGPAIKATAIPTPNDSVPKTADHQAETLASIPPLTHRDFEPLPAVRTQPDPRPNSPAHVTGVARTTESVVESPVRQSQASPVSDLQEEEAQKGSAEESNTTFLVREPAPLLAAMLSSENLPTIGLGALFVLLMCVGLVKSIQQPLCQVSVVNGSVGEPAEATATRPAGRMTQDSVPPVAVRKDPAIPAPSSPERHNSVRVIERQDVKGLRSPQRQPEANQHSQDGMLSAIFKQNLALRDQIPRKGSREFEDDAA